MKLLFDQNLSPKLVTGLADLFPDSGHVQAVELDRATDVEVWEYARLNGFAIVSKDEDFSDLSVMRGSPPKNSLATDRQLHDGSSRIPLAQSLRRYRGIRRRPLRWRAYIELNGACCR